MGGGSRLKQFRKRVKMRCLSAAAPRSESEPWAVKQTPCDIPSGQIIIFHQPRFPWNKGISLTKPPFGVRSCEVAIIWPDSMEKNTFFGLSFWDPQIGFEWYIMVYLLFVSIKLYIYIGSITPPQIWPKQPGSPICIHLLMNYMMFFFLVFYSAFRKLWPPREAWRKLTRLCHAWDFRFLVATLNWTPESGIP